MGNGILAQVQQNRLRKILRWEKQFEMDYFQNEQHVLLFRNIASQDCHIQKNQFFIIIQCKFLNIDLDKNL